MRVSLVALALVLTALSPLAQAQTARQPAMRTATSTQTPPRSPLQALIEGARAGRHAPGHAATLNAPYGLAVDASGRLYVANVFGGITIYDVHHKLVGSITSGLDFPAAVQVAYDGTIYVANNGNNTISVYNAQLSQTGSLTDGTQANPTTMELAEDGSLWVLDAMGVLHEYVNGQPVGTLATGATAVGPWGSNITVWGAPDGQGGYKENFQNLADALHNGAGFWYGFGNALHAGGIAADTLGQQYITDIDKNEVAIGTTSGTGYVAFFPVSAGSTGIAVDSVRGRIYVSNPSQNTVAVYSTHAPYNLIGMIR